VNAVGAVAVYDMGEILFVRDLDHSPDVDHQFFTNERESKRAARWVSGHQPPLASLSSHWMPE
jgi:hypothetical protein